MKDNQIISGLVLNSLFEMVRKTSKNEKEKYYLLIMHEKFTKQFGKCNAIKLSKLTYVADNIFKESWKDFPNAIEVIVPKVAYIMVNKHKELFEPYNIKIKHIKALNLLEGEGISENSKEVANSIMSRIVKL